MGEKIRKEQGIKALAIIKNIRYASADFNFKKSIAVSKRKNIVKKEKRRLIL